MNLPIINNLFSKAEKKENLEKYGSFVPNIRGEKTQKTAFATLTIITSIIFGIFVIQPTLSTISSLQKQRDDAKQVDEAMQQKINNLSALSQKYNQIEQDLPTVYAAVPTSPEIASLTAQIQGISGDTNTGIETIQTYDAEVSREAMESKKFSSYEFSLLGRGEYENLLSLIDNLVAFQRIATLDGVSISKVRELNTTFLQINIRGTVFFKEAL